MRYEWDFTYDAPNFNCEYYETSTYYPDGTFDGKTEHSYDTKGTYLVALKVIDSSDEYNIASEEVYIVDMVYVDNEAEGTGDGSGWRNACTTLTAGLNTATSGQEIWGADGTYKPTTDTDRENTSFRVV